MKLAFVSTLKGSPWGGSEELWTAAAMAARADGHDVLVSRYAWDVTPPKLATLDERGAIIALRPRKPGRIARLWPNPKWLKEIDSFQPDVVCLSQGGAYECAGHRSARPLIKWLMRTGKAFVPVIQFNSEDASCGRDAVGHARWLYQHAAMNAFVARSNITLAEKKLGITIPRAMVVNNPVNLADRSALAWPAGETVRFASVARLCTRTKGQDAIIDILSRREWRARAWTWTLFGEGPDEQRYKDMVATLGLSDRIRFGGHVSDIRKVWAEHHALLLPSRAEGTPLAMMEAMILGRPCLVCDIGGCADWITDGVEGVMAGTNTPGRPEAVAGAMERLWNARDRWPEMGRAGRERALRQLGPDPGRDLLNLLLQASGKGVDRAASLHSPSQ